MFQKLRKLFAGASRPVTTAVPVTPVLTIRHVERRATEAEQLALLGRVSDPDPIQPARPADAP